MSVLFFHADYILPGDAAPIADGAVVVAGRGHEQPEGCILDVGRAAELAPRHAGADVRRVRGILLPGLINAHTHLELSALREKVGPPSTWREVEAGPSSGPEQPYGFEDRSAGPNEEIATKRRRSGLGFVPWVKNMLATRDVVLPEDDADAIDVAVREIVAFGTVAVGDVSNSLAAVPALARHEIGGSVFHEVLGFDREDVLRRVAGLPEAREKWLASWPLRDLAYAPAAHALYSTHPDAVRALLQSARSFRVRTSMHLAEFAGERRAIENDEGPVPEWLYAWTKHRPAYPNKPLFDYADELTALAQDVLLVHLTDAQPDELARIAAVKAPVVLCPRSNLYIEGRFPPFASIREAGIEAALGTDSLASSPSLDVLAEAKTLADRSPHVPCWELVKMATWNGARALGRTDLGRFAKGARPGVIHVEADVAGDPASYLLANLHHARHLLVPRMPSPLP
ncbi:MAG: amidohydrolase family protein [Polyangiaceae bacterium]|nr:amidohydrolase family protein [Polyangiaceae bacterium]